MGQEESRPADNDQSAQPPAQLRPKTNGGGGGKRPTSLPAAQLPPLPGRHSGPLFSTPGERGNPFLDPDPSPRGGERAAPDDRPVICTPVTRRKPQKFSFRDSGIHTSLTMGSPGQDFASSSPGSPGSYTEDKGMRHMTRSGELDRQDSALDADDYQSVDEDSGHSPAADTTCVNSTDANTINGSTLDSSKCNLLSNEASPPDAEPGVVNRSKLQVIVTPGSRDGLDEVDLDDDDDVFTMSESPARSGGDGMEIASAASSERCPAAVAVITERQDGAVTDGTDVEPTTLSRDHPQLLHPTTGLLPQPLRVSDDHKVDSACGASDREEDNLVLAGYGGVRCNVGDDRETGAPQPGDTAVVPPQLTSGDHNDGIHRGYADSDAERVVDSEQHSVSDAAIVHVGGHDNTLETDLTCVSPSVGYSVSDANPTLESESPVTSVSVGDVDNVIEPTAAATTCSSTPDTHADRQHLPDTHRHRTDEVVDELAEINQTQSRPSSSAELARDSETLASETDPGADSELPDTSDGISDRESVIAPEVGYSQTRGLVKEGACEGVCGGLAEVQEEEEGVMLCRGWKHDESDMGNQSCAHLGLEYQALQKRHIRDPESAPLLSAVDDTKTGGLQVTFETPLRTPVSQQVKQDTPPGFTDIRELDVKENWRERTEVVTKADHLLHQQLAREIVHGIVDTFLSSSDDENEVEPTSAVPTDLQQTHKASSPEEAQTTDSPPKALNSGPIEAPTTDSPPEVITSDPLVVPITDLPSVAPATDTASEAEALATDIPTEALATDTPPEALATDAPTEALATDTPPEALATDIPTEAVATDTPPEALATDIPTEALATDTPPEALATDTPTEAVPSSPGIPIQRGAYNIDWDNIDENTNPFEIGSGKPSSESVAANNSTEPAIEQELSSGPVDDKPPVEAIKETPVEVVKEASVVDAAKETPVEVVKEASVVDAVKDPTPLDAVNKTLTEETVEEQAQVDVLSETPLLDPSQTSGEEEAVPSSPGIPIQRGAYNIDWDNIDENTNPFEVGSKSSGTIPAPSEPPKDISVDPVPQSADAVVSHSEAGEIPEEKQDLSITETQPAGSLPDTATHTATSPAHQSDDHISLGPTALTEPVPESPVLQNTMEEAEPSEAPPSSPPIPMSKGAYNIDWDNFDENTNPFQSNVKMGSSPTGNMGGDVNPFASRPKMGMSPPGSAQRVIASKQTGDVNENLSSEADKQRTSEQTDNVTSANTNSDCAAPEETDVKPKRSPPKKKALPKRKGPGGPRRFRPPPNFGQGLGDDVQIFAPGESNAQAAEPTEPESAKPNTAPLDPAQNLNTTPESMGDSSLGSDADVTVIAASDAKCDIVSTPSHGGVNKRSVQHDLMSSPSLGGSGGGGTDPVLQPTHAINTVSNGVPVDEEQFGNSDMFAASLDLLEKCGESSQSFKESALARQSLYVKFDPLVPGRSAPGTEPGLDAEADLLGEGQHKLLHDTVASDDLMLMGTPPNKNSAKHPAARALDQQVAAGDQQNDKIATTPPGVKEAERLFNSSPQATNEEDSGRPASTSPSNQMFDTAGSGSLDLVQVLKFSQSDVNRLRKEIELDYQSRMLAKEQEFQSHLVTKEKDWQKRYQDLEGRIADGGDDKRALKAQIERLNESHEQMKIVVSEYEQTITMLVAEKEKSSTDAKDSYAELVKERDQSLEDLHSVETAFSDLHRRYEKSKTLIEAFKKNEEALKECVKEYQTKLKDHDDKYQSLKEHAEKRLASVYETMEAYKKSSKAELARTQAGLRKAELQVQSLQQSLEQQKKEKEELTSLCEELISKMGK